MDVDIPPTTASSSHRQFSEISIAELPEVLAVAGDSLDPTSDEERWLQILEAVDSIKNSRVSDRISWEERLDAISSTLETFRSSDPRSSWKSSTEHSQQLALHGQKTVELAKQIEKLDAGISRAEEEIRECRDKLRRLDGNAADEHGRQGEEEEDEDEESGRNSLALTMFRQLGFQPAVAPHNLSAATSAISTIFVRSDLKKKVTPFKMDGADDLMQRAQVANAMWDAVN